MSPLAPDAVARGPVAAPDGPGGSVTPRPPAPDVFGAELDRLLGPAVPLPRSRQARPVRRLATIAALLLGAGLVPASLWSMLGREPGERPRPLDPADTPVVLPAAAERRASPTRIDLGPGMLAAAEMPPAVSAPPPLSAPDGGPAVPPDGTPPPDLGRGAVAESAGQVSSPAPLTAASGPASTAPAPPAPAATVSAPIVLPFPPPIPPAAVMPSAAAPLAAAAGTAPADGGHLSSPAQAIAPVSDRPTGTASLAGPPPSPAGPGPVETHVPLRSGVAAAASPEAPSWLRRDGAEPAAAAPTAGSTDAARAPGPETATSAVRPAGLAALPAEPPTPSGMPPAEPLGLDLPALPPAAPGIVLGEPERASRTAAPVPSPAGGPSAAPAIASLAPLAPPRSAPDPGRREDAGPAAAPAAAPPASAQTIAGLPPPGPAAPVPVPGRAGEAGPAAVPDPVAIPTSPGAVEPSAPAADPVAIPAAAAAETDALLARARAFLAGRDMQPARLLLERAMEIGSPDAMHLLGQTYDGRYLRQWRIRGSAPDPVRARALYERARTAGAAGAQADLELLTGTTSN